MNDPRETIRRLQEEAEALPDGPVKMALLEEAVRHADLLHDVSLGYQLREGLYWAANFSGRPDVMLVAFAWLRAQVDRDPRRFDKDDILWLYQSAIWSASLFPDIDRPHLERLLVDMERRYCEAGSTMHAVHKERRDLLVTLGERPAAQAAHAVFRRCQRDSFSSGAAWLANCNLDYYVFQRHWRRAVQAAEPILQGRFTGKELPHQVLSKVLLPLVYLGQIDQAKEYQQRGYRLICRASYQFGGSLARHLRFVALVGDLTQAKSMVERHLASVFANVRLDERFAFFLASRLWTDRLLECGTEKIKAHLLPGVPSADTDSRYDVQQLGQWFTEQAQAIARRFDARNGNDYFQQQIDELPELLRLASAPK